MMKQTLTILAIVVAFTTFAQHGNQYYKVTLLRAKPGQLLELIGLINSDLSKYQDFVKRKPYLIRHSQGDHWDLMLIYPIERPADYFSLNLSDQREGSLTLERPYGDDFFNLVSWQEEAIVQGPPTGTFEQAMSNFNLFHIEIFIALPGKQKELLEQRKAENVFYAGIDHRPNFIFTRVFGPSWDIFTLGWYEDMHDFAGPEVTFEAEDKAAKDAGFEGVNYIGSYLRSLILEHNDTLGWKVE